MTASVGPVATEVRLLPEVIDLSIVLTVSGLGGLVGASHGVLRGYHPDRIGRIVLGATVLGGAGTLAVFLIVLLVGIL